MKSYIQALDGHLAICYQHSCPQRWCGVLNLTFVANGNSFVFGHLHSVPRGSTVFHSLHLNPQGKASVWKHTFGRTGVVYWNKPCIWTCMGSLALAIFTGPIEVAWALILAPGPPRRGQVLDIYSISTTRESLVLITLPPGPRVKWTSASHES